MVLREGVRDVGLKMCRVFELTARRSARKIRKHALPLTPIDPLTTLGDQAGEYVDIPSIFAVLSRAGGRSACILRSLGTWGSADAKAALCSLRGEFSAVPANSRATLL
jgi:hypothetical protein